MNKVLFHAALPYLWLMVGELPPLSHSREISAFLHLWNKPEECNLAERKMILLFYVELYLVFYVHLGFVVTKELHHFLVSIIDSKENSTPLCILRNKYGSFRTASSSSSEGSPGYYC